MVFGSWCFLQSLFFLVSFDHVRVTVQASWPHGSGALMLCFDPVRNLVALSPPMALHGLQTKRIPMHSFKKDTQWAVFCEKLW